MQLQKSKLKILLLYNGTQLYTSTVYEHVNSFAKHSNHQFFFFHHDIYSSNDADLEKFDCIGIHYSIRMPYDNQLSPALYNKIKNCNKLKFLFIQDEYDFTSLTKKKIKDLKINLVFSVVPEKNIGVVYPKKEFPNTKFINVLTGYVELDDKLDIEIKAPSLRPIFCSYRARKLPLRYGKLGFDKFQIAEIVKSYCQKKNLPYDIDADENKRLYSQDWIKFLSQSRSVLGTESGSNIFDWNGNLDHIIQNFTNLEPDISDDDVYKQLLKPLEMENLMNQISPRIFEAIKYRCAMILFEGNYSGVIEPEKHYISLKKDGSNIEDVFRLLQDDSYVNSMTDQVYKDIILPENFSYENFVKKIDAEINQSFKDLKIFVSPPLETYKNFEIAIETIPEFKSHDFSKIYKENKLIRKIFQLMPIKIQKYIKKIYFILNKN
jgi:hypothetical protein